MKVELKVAIRNEIIDQHFNFTSNAIPHKGDKVPVADAADGLDLRLQLLIA